MHYVVPDLPYLVQHLNESDSVYRQTQSRPPLWILQYVKIVTNLQIMDILNTFAHRIRKLTI